MTIFRAVYWLMVASVPAIPLFVLGSYSPEQVCTVNGACFQFGATTMNREAEWIVVLMMILLWPLSAWNLVGKYVSSKLKRQPQEAK